MSVMLKWVQLKPGLPGSSKTAAVKPLMHFARGLKPNNLFSMAHEVKPSDGYTYRIKVSGAALFSKIISLKSPLADFPMQKRVCLDLSGAEPIGQPRSSFHRRVSEGRRAS